MTQSRAQRWMFMLAALFFALLLTGCGGNSNSVEAQAGETVSTVLFDFAVADPETLDSYEGIEVPEGDKLVRLWLTVQNTSEETYTMFAEDFQIQWGDGDDAFGTCLEAVDDTMLPYGYQLKPGDTRKGAMLVAVPQDCTALTVAYEELQADGDRAAAYFVEVPL